MNIIRLLFLTIISDLASAGDDLIFLSGFDLRPPQINCPNATEMTSETNQFGNVFYSATGILSQSSQYSYYTVELSAGDWVAFDISEDNGFLSNLGFSLFDGNGDELLAQYFLYQSQTSSINYLVTDSQNYCIEVQNEFVNNLRNDNFGVDEGGFRLVAVPIEFDDYEGYNLDIEPNDTLLTAQNMISLSGEVSATFLGTFLDQADVDVYSLTTNTEAKSLFINVTKPYPTGSGSTTLFGKIEVVDGNDENIIARINPLVGVDNMLVPVNNDSPYYLRIFEPNLALSDNPFYDVRWREFSGENQQEINDAENDSYMGAEIAQDVISDISPLPNGIMKQYFIGGNLTGSSDEDWWQFEVGDGSDINLFCKSASTGSGVIEANFEMFDDPVALTIQAEIENPTTGLNWSNDEEATMSAVIIQNSNPHYLKISADQFSTEVTGRYYQCGVVIIE